MRQKTLILIAASAASLLSACTMTGTGVGSSRVPGAATTFSWSSQGATTGTMTAQLANGSTYTGQFFQVTSETRMDDLRPLWVGWNPVGGRRGYRGYYGGGGWGAWGPDPQFIVHYSGKVLANLTGPDGQMRCRFTLARPSTGMSGGGLGECQVGERTRIHATFPPR